MMIDFKNQEFAKLDHFKGGEGYLSAKMFFDGQNRVLCAELIPGNTIGLHTHETNSEIIYVLQGTAHMVIDGQDEYVSAGQCHYCPKGHTHTMMNDGPETVAFFAVVPEQ